MGRKFFPYRVDHFSEGSQNKGFDTLTSPESVSIYLNALKLSQTVHCIHMEIGNQDVQSIVSLMSALVVKMLTVLLSTISNSQVILLKKNVSSFCKSHFFSKILAYMPQLMIKVLMVCLLKTLLVLNNWVLITKPKAEISELTIMGLDILGRFSAISAIKTTFVASCFLYCTPSLLCFRHLSESRFLLGALHR